MRNRLGLHAPDDFFFFGHAALCHLNKRQAALAQAHGLCGWGRLALGHGLLHQFRSGMFLVADGLLQRKNGTRHVLGEQYALPKLLSVRLSDDLQNSLAVRLQHNQVAGSLGFEFVNHGVASIRAFAAL